MNVTEVRIRLVDESNNAEKLCAFATITLDNEFVVRDMKIIDGNNGHFVAMPSRKISIRCHKCHGKNAVRSNYCNECGTRLVQASRAPDGSKAYVDVAHPISSDCRERIHVAVVEAYREAKERASFSGMESLSSGQEEHVKRLAVGAC